MSAYSDIIGEIFRRNFKTGTAEFEFTRDDIVQVASDLGLPRPKNVGDVIYSFRYRYALPEAIIDTQPKGKHWVILGAGQARYRFRLSNVCRIEPTVGLLARKVPDATPQIIAQHKLNDEQALLAIVRYNRLVDLFLGVTAYSLQNHLRTSVQGYGQIEIDELYVGVDARGAQFVVPVQAKGGSDQIGVIQTIQDLTYCQQEARFTNCIARAVSAQFLADGTVALFELDFDGNDVAIVQEKHYRLVDAGEITASDLALYGRG